MFAAEDAGTREGGGGWEREEAWSEERESGEGGRKKRKEFISCGLRGW